MQDCDWLLTARWIAPVEPANAVIENGAIAVAEGRICAIGSRNEIAPRWRARRTVDRPRHLIIPGLVNAHTHAAMTLFRGIAEDLPLERWLQEGVWPLEGRHAGPDMVRDGTRLAIAEMVRGGTTTFNDMYFCPDVVAEVAADARMRLSLGLVVIDFATVWAQSTDEYLEKGQAVHDSVRANPLVSTQFAPHSPYAVAPETLARIRTLADQLDIGVHIHLQETEAEVAQYLAAHGMRPVAGLERHGLVNANLLAAHMVAADESDIERFAERGASVVHCPTSNLKLASGIAPVAAMLRQSVNVAIGTDGAASNNTLDLLAETRLAGLLAKGSTGDATVLPGHTLLRMATLNGAHALGIGESTGSLVPGKWADIACVALDKPHCLPVHDPVAALLYAAERSDVTDTWVAGRALLEDGVLTTIDEHAVRERSHEWRRRLQG